MNRRRSRMGTRWTKETAAKIVMVVLLFACPLEAVQGLVSPLNLEQIEALVNLQTPDNVIVAEIQRRGLAFAPTRATLNRLRQIGAGPGTLNAVGALVPMFDEAKKAIPGILDQIYKALNDGNPGSVGHLMSDSLARNAQQLDAICKPFTCRAHYVEAIIERPSREFLARMRVLFEPLEEKAYVLRFSVYQDRFILEEVSMPSNYPSDPWFGRTLVTAAELTRKLVYALNAGRDDVLEELVSPALIAEAKSPSGGLRDLAKLKIGGIDEDGWPRMVSHKGLRAQVKLRIMRPDQYVFAAKNLSFLVDLIDGKPKVVAWDDTTPLHRRKLVEDPNLEAYTLARFGLAAPPPTAVLTTGESESSVRTAATVYDEYFWQNIRHAEYFMRITRRGRSRVRGSDVSRGKMVITDAGEEQISGQTYRKQVKTYKGLPGVPTQVLYVRKTPTGIYAIDGEDQDKREYLAVPFPVTVGRSWTDEKGRTYRVEGVETIEINGKAYRGCLKLSVSSEQWKAVSYLSREIGMVKSVQKIGATTVEVFLLEYKP